MRACHLTVIGCIILLYAAPAHATMDLAALLEKAQSAAERGDHNTACSLYKEILASIPDDPIATRGFESCSAQLAAARALKHLPYYKTVMIDSFLRGDFDIADSYLERILRTDPTPDDYSRMVLELLPENRVEASRFLRLILHLGGRTDAIAAELRVLESFSHETDYDRERLIEACDRISELRSIYGSDTAQYDSSLALNLRSVGRTIGNALLSYAEALATENRLEAARSLLTHYVKTGADLELRDRVLAQIRVGEAHGLFVRGRYKEGVEVFLQHPLKPWPSTSEQERDAFFYDLGVEGRSTMFLERCSPKSTKKANRPEKLRCQPICDLRDLNLIDDYYCYDVGVYSLPDGTVWIYDFHANRSFGPFTPEYYEIQNVDRVSVRSKVRIRSVLKARNGSERLAIGRWSNDEIAHLAALGWKISPPVEARLLPGAGQDKRGEGVEANALFLVP